LFSPGLAGSRDDDSFSPQEAVYRNGCFWQPSWICQWDSLFWTPAFAGRSGRHLAPVVSTADPILSLATPPRLISIFEYDLFYDKSKGKQNEID
jgi:hypothetical protein